jgi:hypothetical protein
MANNRRDDYPALTDPFGYAGEGELLEATLRPRSKGLMLRGTGRTEIAQPGKPSKRRTLRRQLLRSRARWGAATTA